MQNDRKSYMQFQRDFIKAFKFKKHFFNENEKTNVNFEQ